MTTPPAPSPSSGTGTDQALETAWGFMRKLEQTLDSGGEVDFKPLEKLVANLCNQVLALPMEKARTYRDELERLLHSLTAVQQRYTASYGSPQKQVEQLNLQKQAAKAYIRSDYLSQRPSASQADAPPVSADSPHGGEV